MIKHPSELKQIIHEMEQSVLLETKTDKSLSQVWLLIFTLSKLIEEKRIRSNNWNVHADLSRVFVVANVPFSKKNVAPLVKKIEDCLKDNNEINLELDYKKYDLIFKITPLLL